MTDPRDPMPPMAVVISPKEIYDAVVRLTGRVDVLIVQHDTMKTQIQDIKTEISSVESRVRLLESARWPLPAVAILLSIAAIVIRFINI